MALTLVPAGRKKEQNRNNLMQAMSDRVAALARLVAAVERGGESCVRIPAMPADAADGLDGDRAAADPAGTRGLVSERRRAGGGVDAPCAGDRDEEVDPTAGLSRHYRRWQEGWHEDAGSGRSRKPAAADPAGASGLSQRHRPLPDGWNEAAGDPAAKPGLERWSQADGRGEDVRSRRDGRSGVAAVAPGGTFDLSQRHRLRLDGWDEAAGDPGATPDLEPWSRAGRRDESMRSRRDGRWRATAAASGEAFGSPPDRRTWSGEWEDDADCGADWNAAVDPAGVPGLSLDQRLRMAGGSGHRRGLGTPPRAAPHLVALAARARSRPPLPRIAFGVAAIDAALGGGLERAGLHEIHAAAPGDEAAAAGFVAALCRRSLSDAAAALAVPERRNVVRLLDPRSAPAAPDGGPGRGEFSAALISGDPSRRDDGSGRLLAALEGSSDRRGHAPIVSEDPDSNASSRDGHASGTSAVTPATLNGAAFSGGAYVPNPPSAAPGALDDEALSRHGYASVTSNRGGPAPGSSSVAIATLNGVAPGRSSHAPDPSPAITDALEGNLGRCGHMAIASEGPVRTTSSRCGQALDSSSAVLAALNGAAPRRGNHASSQPPTMPAALEDLGRCGHMPVASEDPDGTISHRCGHESNASSATLATLNGATPSRSGHASGQLPATPAALEGRVGRCDHASIASEGPDGTTSSRGDHVPDSPSAALEPLNGDAPNRSNHASGQSSATPGALNGGAINRCGPLLTTCEGPDSITSSRGGHVSGSTSAVLATLNGAALNRPSHAPGQSSATSGALDDEALSRCEQLLTTCEGPDSITSSQSDHAPGSPPVALATLNGAGLSQSSHASRPSSVAPAIPEGTVPSRSGHASSPPSLARAAPDGAAPDRCSPPLATPLPATPDTTTPSAWAAPPGRAVVWIETRFSAAEDGLLSPAGWRQLGLDPADLVHVEVGRVVDALAAAEEALACPALAAVVVEIRGPAAALDLVALRRLTLAARAAGRPCLLLRTGAKPVPTPALTRWSIAARPAAQPAGPATGADRRLMGLPAFAARLTRQRAGPEGDWILEWCADAGCFREPLPQPALSLPGDRPALSLGPSG
jgi:hypothetical protein